MCGIAGIYSWQKKQKVPEQKIENMISAQFHRGPDECGFLYDQNFAMGMSRLSIIDLSGGSQPIHNEDKSIWIVFNGEIFNYIELRPELEKQGHKFHTSSDTEVIVHLYEQYGLDFVQHLNGQFAISIWDTKQKRLVLARDRVGIRPLFYTQNNGTLYFSSEMKSFFTTEDVKPELDTSGIAEIFTYWVNIPPATAFKNIHELPPGHLLIANEKGMQTKEFWNYEFPENGDFSKASKEQLIEETREIIHDAVTLRLRADVPVAAYLSGGIDSSVISSLVKKYHNNELVTFSVAFKDAAYDERSYQEQMAKHIGTRHKVVEVDDEAIAKHFIDVVWYAEKPMMRTAPAPLYALSELVRSNDIKVVLTGEGADEMFGGYNIFKENLIRRFWSRQPDSPWRPALLSRMYPYILKSQNAVNPFWQAFFKKNLMDTNNPYYSHLLRWDNTAQIKSIFGPQIKEQFIPENRDKDLQGYLLSEMKNWHPLNQAQYLEASMFMNGYLLSSQGDRMMMGNSVEGRFPFLDHRVVEFAAKLPPHLKLNGLTEKFALKKAFADFLPTEIINRSKQPYRAPIAQVFLGNKRPALIESLISEEKIKDYGYFNPAAAKQLINKLKRPNGAASARDDMAIVALASTQLMHYHFIENFAGHEFKLPEQQTKIHLN